LQESPRRGPELGLALSHFPTWHAADHWHFRIARRARADTECAAAAAAHASNVKNYFRTQITRTTDAFAASRLAAPDVGATVGAGRSLGTVWARTTTGRGWGADTPAVVPAADDGLSSTIPKRRPCASTAAAPV